MINFYHKAIEKCSSFLQPLYNIFRDNRKKSKSTITEEQEASFEKVKSILSHKTILSFPISHAPTFLATDASDNCIAATLYQFDTAKNSRVPIAFFPKVCDMLNLTIQFLTKKYLQFI